MKKGSIILFFLCLVQIGLTQIDTTKTLQVAFTKANLMSSSFHNGDYKTFLDLTHPKIISLLGGRDKMKELFQQGLGPGVEFVSMELTLPDKLIVQGNINQCAFSQKQVMSVDGQKMYTLGTLIGISYDSGKNWTFIGVSKNSLAQLQVHFPELSGELNVTVQTKPILMN